MAREAGKPASLRELMGGVQTVSLGNLKELLGERMSELSYDRVGKMRLVGALQGRFGVNFRHIAGVNQTLSDFDKQIETNNIVRMNKGEV